MTMTRTEKRESFKDFLDYLALLEAQVPSRNFRDCEPTPDQLKTLRVKLLKAEGVREAKLIYDYLELGSEESGWATDPKLAPGVVDVYKLGRYIPNGTRLHVSGATGIHTSSLKSRLEGRVLFRYSELERLSDHFGYGILYFIKTEREG